jgi:hypothetical protein
LPAAPPAKTSVRATPISEIPAPFDRNRNGRNVRKPIRVALSITPIVSRRGKPFRSSVLLRLRPSARSGRLGAPTALADDTVRSHSRIAPAPNSPMIPITDADERQDITAIRQAMIEGIAILPRSPAKLYVPRAPRERGP